MSFVLICAFFVCNNNVGKCKVKWKRENSIMSLNHNYKLVLGGVE